MPAVPYQPPRLDPDMALLGRALGLTGPYEFTLAGLPARLEPAPVPGGPWPARLRFHLEIGGFLWTVELGDVDLLAEHPGLAGADLAALPEPLRLAALDWLGRPLWAALGARLGTAARPAAGPEAAPDHGEWLELTLRRFGPDGEAGPTPVRLRPAAPSSARWLAEVLLRVLPPRNAGPGPDLPMPAVLAAGRMSVPVRVLAGLEAGDILLPPEYPAAEGRLWLDLPGGRRSLRLALADGWATVLDVQRMEAPMPLETTPKTTPDQTATPRPEDRPEAGDAPGPAPAAADTAGAGLIADLEVTVTFELERKLMTLTEILTLAPGAGFPLGADPLAPVALTVGGRAIARGRLVEMGGVLGVQITAVTGGSDRG